MEEKKDFTVEGDGELEEINVLEFELNDAEIDELMDSLKELKESKGHVSFSIDEENDLLIHHGKDE